MNKGLTTALLLSLTLAGTGCVAPRTAHIEEQTQVPLPAAEQRVALKSEEAQQYRAALYYWRQAEDVVVGKIERLSSLLEEIAEGHASSGVAFYDARQGEKALGEFLEALRYDPNNEIALDYLKNRYTALQFVPYTVKEGDTFASISEAVYGNLADSFAVIHFSGVDRQEDLVAGSEIHLPLLNSFYSQQLLDYKRDIIVARNLFKEEKYQQLLPLVEDILAGHPGDEEASYLLNSTLIGLGERLRQQQKYEQAVAMFSRVDPAFKNVRDTIEEIRKEQQAKLASDTQRLNSELFRKGEILFSKRQYKEALQVFGEIDPQFGGVQEAIAEVKKVMAMQADVHYKRGVKLFIEDNLTAAIKEWQKTLHYDPSHKKASDYIAKAEKLLEKVKALN